MNPIITRSRFLDDFLKDFSPGYFIRPLHGDPLPTPGQIRIDVKDDGDAFTVHADIPGVKKEDLHVEIEGSTVSLRAEVNQIDQRSGNDKSLLVERYAGVVSRAFNLPLELDKDAAKAKYENGVLTLTLPKKQLAKSKRLEVA